MSEPQLITKTKVRTKTIVGLAFIGSAIIVALVINMFKVRVGNVPVKPDLIVASVTAAPSTDHVSFTLLNQGATSTDKTGNTSFEFRDKTGAAITSFSKIGIYTNLSAGQTYSYTFDNSVAASLPAPTAAALKVKADTSGIISESNEENNERLVSWPPNLTYQQSPFDFVLFHNGNKSVTAGSSVTSDITIEKGFGISRSVQFQVDGASLPAGFSGGTFSPSISCTPSPSCFRTLALNVNSTVAPGRYLVTVTGLADTAQRTTSFYVCVGATPQTTPEQCADDITITAADKAVSRNMLLTNTVTLTVLGGTGSVPLNVSVVLTPPANVVSYTQLSSSSCTANPTCSVTLSSLIGSNAPAGQYTFTVQATGAGVTKTGSFKITIQ